MKIYVDFDDCICETARDLSRLAKELYGKDVPYDTISAFDLHEAFGLDDEQYRHLMSVAHCAEFVCGFKETEGAVDTLNTWLDEGLDVEIVTGRPFSSAAFSRRWLDEHGLARLKVVHVDKYGREPPPPSPDAPRALNLEEFYSRDYDFAVEDAPAALTHLTHFPHCRIAVFARPWNAKTVFPNSAFTRCPDWNAVDALLRTCM